jgi:hypothetical protein
MGGGSELSMLRALAAGVGERATGTVTRAADGLPQVTGSLERYVTNFVDASPKRDSGLFEPPNDAERSVLLEGWRHIRRGEPDEAAKLLRPLDMRVAHFTDTTTKVPSNHIVMLEAHPRGPRSIPRGFGLYAHRSDAAKGAVHVQTPHPWDDINTDHVGARVYLGAKGRSLAVAGASRWTIPDSDDDAAHSTVALFNSISEVNARKGARLIQLHGFSQTKNPAYYGEAVVSTGDLPSADAKHMQQALLDAGFEAHLYEATHDYINLGARNNVQGIYARQHGASFVHVELGDSIRLDDPRRERAVTGLIDGIKRAAPKSEPKVKAKAKAKAKPRPTVHPKAT